MSDQPLDEATDAVEEARRAAADAPVMPFDDGVPDEDVSRQTPADAPQDDSGD